MIEKCYMCDAVGTTREHVPPKSFFPIEVRRGLRAKLTVVPSCELHNHSQSKEVEYVRNIIAMSMGINEAGEKNLAVAKRSFEHSPALLRETLKDFENVHIKGQETGIFKGDLDRIRAVMRPIANARYFKDHGTAYTATWKIFITSMTTPKEIETGVSGWEPFVDFVMRLPFKKKDVPEPEVFRYGVFEMIGGIAYEFVFYDGFFVHCWGPTPSVGCEVPPTRDDKRLGT